MDPKGLDKSRQATILKNGQPVCNKACFDRSTIIFSCEFVYRRDSNFYQQWHNMFYLPLGLGFLCSHRGSNLIFHAHDCLLSKKLVGALIVTGEDGAETLADNNSKTMQYIFPPGEYFSSIFPPTY